jgi:hypothetical protein
MFPDKVAGGAEDGTELLPEEVKKDLIEGWLEGWNWRLRTCAMVEVLCRV